MMGPAERFTGNKSAILGEKKKGVLWTDRPQKETPSLRKSWRTTQNWGRMVSRHCPQDLTAIAGHTNVLYTWPIMPEISVNSN